MARRFTGKTLVIATHNAGKLREFAVLLAPFIDDARSAAELGLAEPEETGDSFRANAILKASIASEKSGLPALADDSGLVVPALGGSPGIHSARWAGAERDFGGAMARLEEALPAAADRAAWFVCALALCWPDGHCETVEGRVDGKLTWPPRGDRGFGYDPVFIARDHDITFGEMDPDRKEAISHRADAFRKLIAASFHG